jgi:patatin-like phospholipase/acyl hydrolase
MPGNRIRLLSLDGGGVRGLSSLLILDYLMKEINREAPPKPCDYFDLIGGTSTGGIIAIMLGRLRMTVGECIQVYMKMFRGIFTKQQHRISLKFRIQGRFDSLALEKSIKEVLLEKGYLEEEKLKDSSNAPCQV